MIKFRELECGWIVGVIDAYGSVSSKFVKLGVDASCMHGDIFPGNYFKLWRWSFDNSIERSPMSSEFDIEDWDKIKRHITKKYRIRFWDNGYHDIDYFIEMAEKEEKVEVVLVTPKKPYREVEESK